MGTWSKRSYQSSSEINNNAEGVKAAEGAVGDPVVDAEPGAAGKACFPKTQGGRKM